MENMVNPTPSFWSGRRVFVTGHTGFKGGWLTLWLRSLGAEVHGFALSPNASPNLFEVARVAAAVASSTIADLRDFAAVRAAVERARPDVVFHLAAQPLVRESYRAPVDTYAINVLGLVHLLESLRLVGSVPAVVNVTTDKCYENREWPWPYREDDALGGHDPYATSKACAELVTASYRRAFLADAGIAVATARAGNVIGGGDWAIDRLVPDVLRAVGAGVPLVVRAPQAIRPWQHVLEPLSGYLRLAERLHADGSRFAEAWNFGPFDDDARSVAWIVGRLVARYPGASWCHDNSEQPHEAQYLKLDHSKARTCLGWRPRWRLDDALDRTVEWHDAWRRGEDMQETTFAQIARYVMVGEDRVAV